ncbi:MAG TPA: DNA repair protein RadC [bacterium]|nr:DNA repair protein RadC [bacterium]
MATLSLEKQAGSPLGPQGHRQRLRDKYARGGAPALQDYELLELLLSFSIPQRDTKPYAKRLVAAFPNLKALLEADLASLRGPGGLPAQSALLIKALGDLYRLAGRETFRRGTVLGSPGEAAAFFKDQLGSRPTEAFAAFFLDHRNHLLSFEVLQEGTVDQTAVYPREVLKRALDLKAGGLLVAHNHPGGSLQASEGDRQLTRQLSTAARALGITLHDHLIVTAEGHFSFRQAGLL